ncbi:ThiF family adenylyltransferase [Kitasatospora sp. NPDC059817]|uniref:ThiF family adenylyltransferase n=1 Tax=Kitasatospora sp. NPDC059817 TaxID=3346961 RepID=UPI0036649C36
MSRKKARYELTAWQKMALADLREAAAEQPGTLRLMGVPVRGPGDSVAVTVRLHTGTLPRADGGLTLKDQEEFVLTLPALQLSTITVDVTHLRFAGYPHVLQGHRLCVFLDPAREWDPVRGGMRAFLNRLWSWLTDAAAGRFNPSTAMYHAVGGVLHHTPGTPTIVVRESVPDNHIQIGFLSARGGQRLDLSYGPPPAAGGSLRVPVVTLPTALPLGGGSSLSDLLARLDAPDLLQQHGPSSQVAPHSPAILTALATSAFRNPAGSPQYLVLAVPHPAGGPPHLLTPRLPAPVADGLRRLLLEHGTALNLNASHIRSDLLIEWCPVSDERPAVTTRRDNGTPISGFFGKHVQVWGCGGLGSWMAEFAVRAGAAQVSVCDPGTVTGGLLVRQNYVEADVGAPKALALADRLRAISDTVVVHANDGILPPLDDTAFAMADVVIDATVSIAMGHVLNHLAAVTGPRPVLAQVATDVRTGTLGLLSVSAPGTVRGPSDVDASAGQAVLADPALELYHPLWQDSPDGDELVPTRGCSVPTFHGSSADLAAVAGTLMSFLGMHLKTPTSGTHLVALPHAAGSPHHRFVAHQEAASQF